MKFINKILCILLFLFSTKNSIIAQDLNFPGTAPSISLGIHLKKTDLNYLAASKTRVGRHTIKDINYESQVLEIYTQLLANRKLNDNWQIAAGYGFQRNNPLRDDWRNEHRLVQQVMFTIHGGIKFNNRLRFEERWFSFPASPNQFSTRARYLAGIIKQLNKNLYWQASNEVFATTSGNRYSFISENWLYSGIGFPVKSFGHFETGIGYNSVVRNSEKEWVSLILLQVNWSFVIPSGKKEETHPVLHSRHF